MKRQEKEAFLFELPEFDVAQKTHPWEDAWSYEQVILAFEEVAAGLQAGEQLPRKDGKPEKMFQL